MLAYGRISQHTYAGSKYEITGWAPLMTGASTFNLEQEAVVLAACIIYMI